MKRRSSRPKPAKIIRQKFTAEVAITFEYDSEIGKSNVRSTILDALRQCNAPITKATVRTLARDSKRVIAA